MSNLVLRIDESSDLSFDAVDFVGIPFAPTVEVEDIVGGHRVSITSMGADGKKTDEFDVMDGETWLSGNILTGTLSEAAVLTADDAYAAPPKFLSVYGKSTQDGTPTPDAPVAIQSVDNLTLHACGFNQWDEQWEVGTLNADGDNALSTSTIRSKNYVPVLPSVTYYAIVLDNGAIGRMCFYDAYKVHIAGADIYIPDGGREVTMPVDTRYLRFVTSSTYGATYKHDICINISDASRNGTYAPYTGTTIPVPFSNNIARSLPDGTRDTLTLSYIGQSTEHEGWGVYSAELVQRVWHVDDVSTLSVGTFDADRKFIAFYVPKQGVNTTSSPTINVQSPYYQGTRLLNRPCCYVTGNGTLIIFGNDDFADRATAVSMLSGVSLDYQLATTVTHDLGTVELPILPNPLTAWADGGSAQPTMQLEYERALNIVIPRIEAQLADMATS